MGKPGNVIFASERVYMANGHRKNAIELVFARIELLNYKLVILELVHCRFLFYRTMFSIIFR